MAAAVFAHVTATDLSKEVFRLLTSGHRNARTAGDIAARLGCSERQVRRAIEVLAKEQGVPVATSTEEEPRGAFLLETEAEYQRYRRQLLSRAEELSIRIRALDRAWANRRAPVSLLSLMSEPHNSLESA